MEDHKLSLNQKLNKEQGLKEDRPRAYTEIFKDAFIGKRKDSFIEKLFRSFESICFSPINIGWGASNSELEIFHYSKSFSHVRYLYDFHTSPEVSDLLIIHGTLNRKYDNELLNLYNKLQKPCYVIELGHQGLVQDYCRSQLLGEKIPVDLFIPGSPSPDEIMESFELLRKKIKGRHGVK